MDHVRRYLNSKYCIICNQQFGNESVCRYDSVNTYLLTYLLTSGRSLEDNGAQDDAI